MTDANGQVKEYVAADTADEVIRTGQRRTMDCIDCHNTVGHPIAPSAEQAVDRAIAAARVGRELPFARREGIRLLKEEHPSQDEALSAIDRGLRSFYESQGGKADQRAVARSVTCLLYTSPSPRDS